MLKSYLDFEQPIADLEQQVIDLKDSDLDDSTHLWAQNRTYG